MVCLFCYCEPKTASGLKTIIIISCSGTVGINIVVIIIIHSRHIIIIIVITIASGPLSVYLRLPFKT